MEILRLVFELAQLGVSAVAVIASPLAALLGVWLGSWITERREARRIRRISGPVSHLLLEEIAELEAFWNRNGSDTMSSVVPSTPTHDEYSGRLLELFDPDRALAIARFYRALSAVERAHAEAREASAISGPGGGRVVHERQEAVRKRILTLSEAAEKAKVSLQATRDLGSPA